MKKIICFVLSCCMILTGAFSGAVIAADSADSSRIVYFNDFNEDIYRKTTITPKSNSISLYEGKKNVKALKIAAADGKAVEDALVSLNAKSDFEKIVVSMDLSVEVGGANASRLGELVATHVIPRPHSDVEKILPTLK